MVASWAVGVVLPESFSAFARELLFACRVLCCGLVLRLHSFGGLSGGKLA
jgi:hypothetical protein